MVETFVPPGEEDPSVPAEDTMLVEEVIGVILYVSAAVLAGAQIVMRALFNVGLVWGQEGVVILIVWAVYIGAAAVTARRRHVRMDLIAMMLPTRPAALLETVAALAFVAYVVLILIAAARFQYFLFEGQDIDPSTGVPTWTLFLGLPLGVLFMLRRSVNDLRARFASYRYLL